MRDNVLKDVHLIPQLGGGGNGRFRDSALALSVTLCLSVPPGSPPCLQLLLTRIESVRTSGPS